jgi:hypothetical protein
LAFVVPTTSTTATASSSSSLAAAQQTIPLVSEWKVLRNGAIQGFVRNHPNIPNGDVITTSPLADRNSQRTIRLSLRKRVRNTSLEKEEL